MTKQQENTINKIKDRLIFYSKTPLSICESGMKEFCRHLQSQVEVDDYKVITNTRKRNLTISVKLPEEATYITLNLEGDIMTNGDVPPTASSTNSPVSEVIKRRLLTAGKRFHANDNIAQAIESDEEKQALIDEVALKFQGVLESLIVDLGTDPNSQDTPRRLAKMYINEIYAGRYTDAPKATAFPNEKLQVKEGQHKPAYSYNGLLIVPAELHSTCSHHLMPVRATAFIGIIPGEKVIGLSKYVRIAQHQARRGTLQEQLTHDILEAIQKAAGTSDVAVYIEATHGCMECRGVEADDSTTQSVELGGVFIANPSLREEFYHNLSLRKR